MTDAPVESISNRTLKLTIRDPGKRRPTLVGRVWFAYDGTHVHATRYRSTDVVGDGEVASVERTGGCGCGGRLGLRFTLTTGEEWNV